MKRLLPVLMGFVFLLLSSTEGWSLPRCPDSPTSSASTAMSWSDCFGTLTLANGSKYVGDWKDGKTHGQGTYTYANGDKYVGEFNDGNFNGQGTATFANGEKYVGEWKDGKRNGQGTFKHWDGTIQEGIWENDKFKSARD